MKDLKNWYSKKNLYVQISIVAGVTCAAFLLFLSVFAWKMAETFEKNNDAYTDEIACQLEQTIRSNYTSVSKILRFVSFQSGTQEFLLETDSAEKFQLYRWLQNSLMNVQDLNDHIRNIIIVDREREYNLTGDKFEIPGYLEGPGKITLSSLQHRKEGEEGYFLLYSPIYSIDAISQTNRQIGMIYLVLDQRIFAEGNQGSVYSTAKSKLFLTDSIGNYFWSNSSMEYPRQEQADRERYKITTLPDIGLHIISIKAKEDTVYAILNIQKIYFIVFAVLLGLILILWVQAIRNIVKPLNQLVDFIMTIRDGVLKDLGRRVKLSGYREIGVISREFNEMLSTIDGLTHQLFRTTSQLYEAELLKNQAEMEHLRSQINPHFLYNTLESIKGIAARENQPEIMKITKALGNIFKYSVKGKAQVKLADELKIITNYISIQLVRFEGRFHVSYEIDKTCEGCIVPKMILQPIVENAIVHGIENCDRDALLIIRAEKKEGKLWLTVFNEGVPIVEQKLLEIRERLQTDREQIGQREEDGIGIFNVNSRIKLLHGNQYGLLVDSDGTGTAVTIRLPVLYR